MKSFFFKFTLVAALWLLLVSSLDAEARYGVVIHCTKMAGIAVNLNCKCDLALSMCNCFVPPVGVNC
ncbi:hypothetical protein CUMW_156680 [Citrus unshiu]|uniref:Hydrophobic seed protein domain-containing protein n=1 Tax=Citrus unshiu TaxID=55188 RepID=A0A2H5PPY9_CITUN|nr:hypothetical protein CUMW_156680 [Citrus unshiu]